MVYLPVIAGAGGGAVTAATASPDVVISEVYGGGGNSGAPYRNDFVELFNRGSSSVSLAGLSIQYASATGTGAFASNPEEDAITFNIDGIFQDEPVNAPGDGATFPDGAGVGGSVAQIRAERAATGNGRVYHVQFTAADGFGGACSGVVQVAVPNSRYNTAVDDGPLYDSTVGP